MAAEDVQLANADAINKPPSGVVIPPKEIRVILEKTAGYVARNGNPFEERIRQKEKANPKFSFLTDNDAYHEFYVWRLSEIRAGRGTAVSAGREGDDGAVQGATKPKGPKPPPEFLFSARMPNISAQDLDVLKLTAFFVARNGRNFMTNLSQREATNYQFDFLRPQHSLYQYFTRLVDQYSELLNARNSDGKGAEKTRMAELNRNVQDKLHILDRAKKRADWVKYEAQQKQQKEEEAEAEKMAYAQIDWHDFVVVEVVTFTEADDAADLPPPTSLNDLQSASLEQKAYMSLQPNHMRLEEAMPTDEPYQQPQPPPLPPQQQQQQQALPQQMWQYPQQFPYQNPTPTNMSPAPTFPMHPPPPGPIHSPVPPPVASPDPATRPPVNAPMKIRSDYIPRAQAQRRNVATSICPNCKQEIPVDEMSEHMRIELLDPRWREQSAKAADRYSTTNLSTAEVANNLKRLASQRTDVFDSASGESISEGEAARRKRAAMSYDGVITGVNDGSVGPGQAGAGKAALSAQAREKAVSGRTLDEQIRHIQEKARGAT